MVMKNVIVNDLMYKTQFLKNDNGKYYAVQYPFVVDPNIAKYITCDRYVIHNYGIEDYKMVRKITNEYLKRVDLDDRNYKNRRNDKRRKV
jgi:hypothetical protein